MTAASLVWALTFLTASYLIKGDHLPEGLLSWVVAALPSVAALWVLLAFVQFLRDSDELQRLIQLQALAFGFGGGFFFICGYHLFEYLGAPKSSGIDLLAAMPLLYVLGVQIGQRRYG